MKIAEHIIRRIRRNLQPTSTFSCSSRQPTAQALTGLHDNRLFDRKTQAGPELAFNQKHPNSLFDPTRIVKEKR
jgi:hypothetical protein